MKISHNLVYVLIQTVITLKILKSYMARFCGEERCVTATLKTAV